jgi:transcriptional regulator with XRE-family HTH domain
MVGFVDFVELSDQSNHKNVIGDRVKKARKNLKISRIEFCKMASISPNTLISIENGKQFPSGDQVLGISMALELSPNMILCGLEEPFSKSDSNVCIVDLEKGFDKKNVLAFFRLMFSYSLLDVEYQSLVSDNIFRLANITLQDDNLIFFKNLWTDDFFDEDIDLILEQLKPFLDNLESR